VVVKECLLPELKTDEFMVFKNMGAYTISGAVAFNGIPLARCIYVASTSWDTIKNAFVDESIADSESLTASGSPLLSTSLPSTMMMAASAASAAATAAASTSCALAARSMSIQLDDHIDDGCASDSGDEVIKQLAKGKNPCYS
jgi:hypothetical protein